MSAKSLTAIELKMSKPISYPYYLVVWGRARNYRTTYRAENDAIFAADFVNNVEEAIKFVEDTNKRYGGRFDELEISGIYWGEDTEIDENGEEIKVSKLRKYEF